MSISDNDLEQGQKKTGGSLTLIDPLRVLRRYGQRSSLRATNLRRNKKLLVAGSIAGGLLAVAILTPIIWLKCNKLPDIKTLETYTPVQAVSIYDGNSKLIAVVSGEEDRRPVKLSQVSPEMKLAMIGAEDHDFYRHGGINTSSIMRAAMVNLQAGRIVEGGSTITQQLVKNLFFPGERRTFNRKIKEFFLANDVAAKYSKNRILEMYLNQIYFGNQAYGIEAAAQRYFDKPASALTMGESTFLAGLVKSPSALSNPEHRDAAFARQRQVLDQMVGYGMLTKDQAEKARVEKLKFRKFVNPYQQYPYYVSYVMDELREHYGEQELQHGLKVYTYLDPIAQAAAEKAMTDGIAHAPGGVTQGALVSLKVNDGGVVALVGGVGKFEDHQWNRAVSPHTMGSSFKPFVYLTGFLHGLTPDSIVPDEPFSAPSGGQYYSPRNFDNRFMGPLTVMKALTFSRNVCAVRVAAFCGIKNVIDTAHLAGLTSRLDPYLPTAVGAGAASPLEMAGAYSTFARGGIYLTPHLMRRVDGTNGKRIYLYDEKPKKVFDSTAVSNLVSCMQNVVAHGTGIYAQIPGRLIAGKTGTADKARDIWFVGFTPDTCTAVWGGNDHNKAVYNRSVTGGMIMAGMWKKYMVAYYDAHPTPVGSFIIASKTPVTITTDDVKNARKGGITPVGASVVSSDDQSKKQTKDDATGAENGKTADADKDNATSTGKNQVATSDKNNDGDDSTTTVQKPAKKARKVIVRKNDTSSDDASKKQISGKDSDKSEKETADKPAADPGKASESGAPSDHGGQAVATQNGPPVSQPATPIQSRPVYIRMPNGQLYLYRTTTTAAPQMNAPRVAAPTIIPQVITQPSVTPRVIVQPSPMQQVITQPSPMPQVIRQPSAIPQAVTQPSPVPQVITQPSVMPQTVAPITVPAPSPNAEAPGSQ
jgi:penicillin-binding protein 1A